MNVLHVYKTYFPDTSGGVEQVIYQIARGASQFGVNTEVLSLTSEKKDDTINFNGHKVHRCKSNIEIASTPFSISAFRRFAKLVKEVDIVHYHFPYPFADMLHLFTRVKKPTVLTYQSDIIRQKNLAKLYNPLKNYFLSNMNRIVVTSPNYLKSSPDLNLYKDHVRIIPIGIDKSLYPTPSADKLNYWKQQFGEKFFLFVGFIRYYKGLHILIEAASKIDYPIVIVGSGSLLNELKETVAKLGLKNVHFVGFMPNEDKVALLQLCYGFIFPSHLRAEAFGVSLLEGAMYGKPLISCEIETGTTYVNVNNETGIVVPPSDSNALKDAMVYLWNHPEEAATMGKNAEARYRNIFLGERMVKAYIELYEELLSSSHHSRALSSNGSS